MIDQVLNALAILNAGYAAAATLAGVTVEFQHRALRRKVLAYCSRDEAGHLYVRDPQTGTEHRFDEFIRRRIEGDAARQATPRQRRRARRTRSARA